MRQPPGGFLGGGNILRSLTLSPMNAALQQAHQMARRRHLDAGGAAAPASGRVDRNHDCEFLVPGDIDVLQFAMAMEGKLANGRAPLPGLGIAALSALQMRPNGQVMVLPDYVQRLGRRFLDNIVAEIRAGRAERKPFGPPPERLQPRSPSRHL